MLRIGTVPYLVARPLTEGLDAEPSVQLSTAPPAELARRLSSGELDIALASSILALGEDALDFWSDGPVIACDGPIQSVLLFLSPRLQSPSEIQSLLLDPNSRTGRELARICLRDAFDLEPHAIEAPLEQDPFESGADAVQLIGDPALLATQTHPDWTTVDLGETWKKLTGLPFVFAGWICRTGFAPEEVAPILEKAAERGLSRRSELAQSTDLGNLPIEFLDNYLHETIHFRLSQEQIRGAIAEFGLRADLDIHRIRLESKSVAQ